MFPITRSVGAATAALLAALLTLFALAATPALAAGGHDDHDGGGPIVIPPDADRCDLGFNTKGYNDLIRSNGLATSDSNFKKVFMQPLTWQEMFKMTSRQFSRFSLAWNISQHMLDGRNATGHNNMPLADPWKPMTDPVACDKLKSQLVATRDFAAKYPTLKDAVDAGFTFITPWFAGAGAHLGRWEKLDSKVEIGEPEVLIYDGNADSSKLTGAMYATLSDTAPKGVFAGANDVWHQHKGLCFTENQEVINRLGFTPATKIVLGSETATKYWCETLMKGKVEPFDSLYMMHAWVVPGCTSKYGVFSHDLPYLTVRNYLFHNGKPEMRGCGTGIPVTAPNTGFETNELNIPGRLSNYRSSQFSWKSGGQTVASGPVAAVTADHPGEVHAGGELHFTGTLETEAGFTGPAGKWPVSIYRKDGVIRGSVTTPSGTVATFTSGKATQTEKGVALAATATVPGGEAVELAIEFADSGLRSWFFQAQGESLEIHHPAHGHAHAGGPVTYALSTHPGENHVGEEHLFGTATTKDAFEGDAGAWIVSFTKNLATKQVNGYLKNPADSKRFNFSVTAHHAAEECAGGVHLEATGSEQATPADPQNPELVICDPAATAFFADHDHGQTPAPTTPGTPAPTTPGDGHAH